jgi:hypothetical protein
MNRRTMLTAGAALSALAATAGFGKAQTMTATESTDYRKLSDMDWRQRLDASQYMVLRQHGTERSIKKSARAPSSVPAAICRFSPRKRSSKAARAGRASISLCLMQWRLRLTDRFS